MRFLDRLLTIAVTATLTSAAWIVFGSGFVRSNTVDTASPPQAGSPGAARPDNPALAGSTAAQAAGSYVIPVAGVAADQLTDTFTDSRADGARLHDAIDIMAARGTPVVAAAEGTVEKLFLSEAGGQTVYVRSPDRQTIYYYAHLDGYAPGLKEGQKLARGDPVGTVGSTGNASPDGPHLHFAIMRIAPDAAWYDPATAINPYPLLIGSSG
ncbi:M23 family metallopeptidase [Tsuneonella sp. HG222]